MSNRPWEGRRLHLLGVGGSGMSGYARAAHALGASVSGSDRADSPALAELREQGIVQASIGHDAANLPAGEDIELVYSSAVPAENPERVAARERGLAEHPRAWLLGELSALRRTIAVAGTHGKTTTSSMIVHALLSSGTDPGWLVGAPLGPELPNARWSEGEWLVVEADESDRSMLSLHIEIAVLTNVELDHHATFGSIAQLREAFGEFLARAPIAVIWERPELLALRGGQAETRPYDVAEPELSPAGSRFQWHGRQVTLAVPGAHNAINAAGALEAAAAAGAPAELAIAGVGAFTGAGRRFQRLGFATSGAEVVDDYAHHPTEVAATLRAARTLRPKRLVAVFQPHLYSRTAMLADGFGAALAQADVIALLDVYAARERVEDHPGVSGLTIARAASEHASGRTVLWLPAFDDAERALGAMLEQGDLCVMMGAGDIDKLSRRLVARSGA
jgi:UDP-N-acetylmuramate--alanine ligase